MSKLKSLGSFSELFNREKNRLLRTSRAVGTSAIVRIAVLTRLLRARAEDPNTLIAYWPPVPKGLETAGHFRKHKKAAPRKPCKAEVEILLTSKGPHRDYVRLDNGQIVKALRGGDTLHVFTPAQIFTLRPEDQKLLPVQPM